MNEDVLEKPGQVTEKMKDALGRAWAMEGFRDWLLFTMRVANQNAMTLLATGKAPEAQEQAIKLKVFERIREQSKMCYDDRELLLKRRKELPTGDGAS